MSSQGIETLGFSETNYNKINKFVLCLEGKKDFEMFVDMSGVTVTNGLGNTVRFRVTILSAPFCAKNCWV